MWQHVKLSLHIRPWDTLASCWDVKQPTINTQSLPSPTHTGPQCIINMVSKTESKHVPFCLFSFHLLLTYFPNHSAYRMSFANFIFYPILLCSLSGQCNMSCLIQAQGYTVLSPTKFLIAYIKFWKQQTTQYNWIKHCLCKPEWKHVETERGWFSITWEETNTTNQAHCYTSSLLCHAHSLQVSTAKSQCRNY